MITKAISYLLAIAPDTLDNVLLLAMSVALLVAGYQLLS